MGGLSSAEQDRYLEDFALIHSVGRGKPWVRSGVLDRHRALREWPQVCDYLPPKMGRGRFDDED